MQNSVNNSVSEVISTYVYKQGIGADSGLFLFHGGGPVQPRHISSCWWWARTRLPADGFPRICGKGRERDNHDAGQVRFIRRSRADIIFDIINTFFLVLILTGDVLPASERGQLLHQRGERGVCGHVWFWPVGFSTEALPHDLQIYSIWRAIQHDPVHRLRHALQRQHPRCSRRIRYRAGIFRVRRSTCPFHVHDDIQRRPDPVLLNVLNMGLINTFWHDHTVRIVGMERHHHAHVLHANLGGEILDASQIDGCTDFMFFFSASPCRFPARSSRSTRCFTRWASGTHILTRLIYCATRTGSRLQIILRRIGAELRRQPADQLYHECLV
jgi:hypothetical protein